MKGVVIKTFFHSDETRKSKDMNMHYDYTDCDVVNMVFYNINALSEEIDGDNKYAVIHCNGAEFISPLTVGQVVALIERL